MRYSFIILLSFLSLLSCQSNLEVVSAKRKTIYPGVQTANPYVKFVVTLKTSDLITIDSATIVDKNKCYKLNRIHTVIEKSGIQKKHIIEVLFKGNENVLQTSNTSDNGMLTLYYTASNSQKSIEISSFTNQKETRR